MVANSKEIVGKLSYEISNRFIDNTASAIGGSARGGWDSVRGIFQNLWQR